MTAGIAGVAGSAGTAEIVGCRSLCRGVVFRTGRTDRAGADQGAPGRTARHWPGPADSLEAAACRRL